MSTTFYVVINDDEGEVVGVYSSMDMAAQAMACVQFCHVCQLELDELPDEPEPREPDLDAPSAHERLMRDSFDADRGAR